MSVRSAEDACQHALASKTNSPGKCQAWTHNMYLAPGVGDVDHDGDADAVDGWKKEPSSLRHTDRNPPRGAPVAWSGGSHGYGHRAISLGGGLIRSIDVAGSGRVGTVTLGWFEKNWHLNYLGWSQTISGIHIPQLKLPVVKIPVKAPDPTPAPKKTIAVIAQEVIAGKWGEGDVRVKKLTNAGYNPKSVQTKVNQLLK